MFAALKISKFGWIVSLSLLLTMIMVAATTSVSIYKTEHIESAWSDLEQQSIRRTHLLNQIQRIMGYDGVIYHFKDYLLRRNRLSVMKVHQKIFELSIALNAFNGTKLQDDEQRAFLSLITLIKLYKKNIILAEVLTDQGRSQAEIDAIVKIDSTVVNKHLQKLDRFHLNQFANDSEIVTGAIYDLHILTNALRFILISVLLPLTVFIIWYIHKRLILPFAQFSIAFNATQSDQFACTQLPIEAHLKHTELGQFASAFNIMMHNLEKSTAELKFQKHALDEHAIVSIADVKGNIIYVNNKFCQISQYSKNELIGQNHRICKSKEHPVGFFEELWSTISSGKPWHGEIRNISKYGKEYWVQTTIVPTLNDAGKPFQYVAIRTEITNNKKQQEALFLTQADLRFQKRALDEHAIVSIADVKGNIIYVNNKFCRISQYSQKELLGQNHHILKSTEHSGGFFKDMWLTISSGKSWHGEIKNINKSGGEYWVQTTIVPTLNDSGKPFQYVAICTEITSRKVTEKNLFEAYAGLERKIFIRTQELEKSLQAEKEASVMQKQFVSMASHEFRTPLSIIDMTAQRLLKRHSSMSEDQIVDRFNKIRNASKRITGLIESTLSSARLEDGKVSYTQEQCDLRTHICECIETQMDVSQDYEISIDLEKLPEQIFADTGHLNQIFTNLLSNAVKYSPQHKQILVKGWVENDHAKVSVIDRGIGIPKSEQSKMFNRFFRTSSAAGIPGTGIGLNLVKQLVELQGGKINFESIDGEGSTFTVSLRIKPHTI